MIKDKEFALIAITKDFTTVIDGVETNGNYERLEILKLRTGSEVWKFEFLIPKIAR